MRHRLSIILSALKLPRNTYYHWKRYQPSQHERVDNQLKEKIKLILGITKSQILPHYNLIKNEYLDGKRLFEEITYPDSFGRSFITLNDGCYLYGDGQYEIVYGESFIISDGTIKK
ncbi:transposase [Lactiplantibacillus plantarum]|nr:transposase [Lactiplantibacillus plantarum]